MTKDELKNEAEKYAEQCYGWTNNDQVTDVAIATYITSAEPREKQIEELEQENKKLESDFRVCEKNADTYYDQLTKATDLLKKMYYLYFDPCVTHKDLENRDKLFEEVKQFIKE